MQTNLPPSRTNGSAMQRDRHAIRREEEEDKQYAYTVFPGGLSQVL